MKLSEFIRKRPHLIWYTRSYNELSAESIVEAVLNYGDWNDVQTLIKILGVKRLAKIFKEKSKKSKIGRCNYRPEIKNYFSLYFKKHAHA